MRGYLNNVNFGSTNFSRQAAFLHGGNGQQHFAFGLSDATNMGHGGYGAFRLGDIQFFSRAITADEIDRTFNLYAYRYRSNQYANWNPGEPNNSGNEDYTQFVSGGKWNDLANTSLPYVIEFDYIVTTSAWSLYKTVYTNSLGYYNFNETSDPSKEYYIQIDAPSRTQSYSQSDGQSIGNLVLGKTSRTGLSFHMFDLNNDSKISISDQYYLFGRRSGRFSSWGSSVPDTRLYSVSQYNLINSSSANVRSTYPGVVSYTTPVLTSGGTLNYYIIAPGYSGQVTY